MNGIVIARLMLTREDNCSSAICQDINNTKLHRAKTQQKIEEVAQLIDTGLC